MGSTQDLSRNAHSQAQSQAPESVFLTRFPSDKYAGRSFRSTVLRGFIYKSSYKQVTLHLWLNETSKAPSNFGDGAVNNGMETLGGLICSFKMSGHRLGTNLKIS